MKKALLVVLGSLSLASALNGCAYGGAAMVGEKVVIARNDAFLFGALRTVFVCKVSDAGVTGCMSAESP